MSANVKCVVDSKGILTITVDTNAKGAASKSGKSMVIATTNGFVTASSPSGDVRISLNVIR
jgi:hypothetical protein